MSGFKETEIGLMPEDWEVREIKDLVLDTETRNPQKEPTKKIKYIDVSSVSNQTFSVISYQDYLGKDAPGRARKVVYTNDVIFATVRPTLKRVAKISQEYNGEYCSTAFCVLRADKNKLDFEFLYQYLLTNFFVKKISKYQSGASYPAVRDDDVKKTKMPYPPLNEQCNIAKILSIILSAIETQEKIIKTTTELKKAFMQKLFTEGLRSEPQKETEIGKMPKSWDVSKTIKDLVLDTETRNPAEKEPNKPIKYVDVSSVSNQTFSVIGHQDFLGKNAPGRARKVVYTNDVIFATIRPTLKRVAKINWEYNDEYCSTAFCVLRADRNKLDFEFLYQYLLTDSFIKEIEKFQSGASYPAVRDDNVKKMKIPYPELDEQKEMGNVLKQLDCKKNFAMKKSLTLQFLFKSMLHHLMTGQIRVKDLKFS